MIGHALLTIRARAATEGETTVNSFILKLFFTGLMAFVPSQDGKEVTVLLLNVDHDYHILRRQRARPPQTAV